MCRFLAACVAALGLLASGVVEARADLLYSNGSGIAISDGIAIDTRTRIGELRSNSFTLTSASQITSVQVGLLVRQGETPGNVQWSMGSTPFSADLGNGMATPS